MNAVIFFLLVVWGWRIDAAAVKVVDKALVDFNSFPTVFKDQRISLGYTQAEVSNNILHCTGYQITPTTISLLECNKLEKKKVEILYPHLMEWMTSARPHVYPLQLCGPRKKGKTFSNHELNVLHRLFYQKSRPSPEKVRDVACSLDLDPVIVQRWFHNRNYRRKAKKQN